MADFIIRSLRNRARSDTTLRRVVSFIRDFHRFAVERETPLPFHGAESLIAITKRMEVLKARGNIIPRQGRYALRVVSEAIGVVFRWAIRLF